MRACTCNRGIIFDQRRNEAEFECKFRVVPIFREIDCYQITRGISSWKTERDVEHHGSIGRMYRAPSFCLCEFLRNFPAQPDFVIFHRLHSTLDPARCSRSETIGYHSMVFIKCVKISWYIVTYVMNSKVFWTFILIFIFLFFFIYLDLFSNNAFRWLSSAFYFPRFWMKDSGSVFNVKVKSREKLLSIFQWRAEVSWLPGGTRTDVYACAAYTCDLYTRGTKNVTVPWSKATLLSLSTS